MYIVSFCDSTPPARRLFIMDATHYWLFAREYSIWNATVVALPFWMADLEPQTLSNTIEWVYTAFFCSTSAVKEHIRRSIIQSLLDHTKWCFWMGTCPGRWRLQQWEWKLNILTPLWRTPHLYHVSMNETLSFGPATPLTHWTHSPHWHSSPSSVCCCLTFNDSSSTDTSPLHGRTEHSSPAEQQMVWHLTDNSFFDVTCEEEHFPTAPLDDDIWMEEPVPDRHLCIHEHSQPHDLCPYPCPYSLDQLHLVPEYAPPPQYMDLSDIFDFPNVMTTPSNEDIPNLEDVLEL